MTTLKQRVSSLGPEPFIWSAALIYLAFLDPFGPVMVSLCPLHNLGFSFCPGCGLGLAISYFLHGEIAMSLESHPLGIAATVILVFRVVSVIVNRSQQSATYQRILT